MWNQTSLFGRFLAAVLGRRPGPMGVNLGRLNRAISLAILGAGAAVMILFGAVLYPYEMKRQEARLEEASQLMSAVFQDKREDLANEIFDNKLLALDQSFAEILGFSNIVGVSAYDLDGRLLRASHPGAGPGRLSAARMEELRRGPSLTREALLDKDVAVYRVSIEDLGEQVGFLSICYDLRDIKQETLFTMVGFLILLLSLLSLMALLLTTLLRCWVILPVNELRDAITHVQQGRLGEQVRVMGRDEVAEVAASFNDMSLALKRAVDVQQTYSAQLQAINEELAAQAAELERANVRLRELDRLKSAFLSSVSHELRTPLTSVRGFAKIIRRDFSRLWPPQGLVSEKDGRLAERIVSNLEIIDKESDRLSNMVNDFLDLARIESGRMQWRVQDVDVRVLAERALDSVAGLFAEKPLLRLVSRLEHGLPVLRADEDQLLQVLINLLSNAAKFTERGEVWLEARRNGSGWVRLSVGDQGVGIPAEDLAVIFDAFRQASHGDLLANKPRGTGLGLAICTQIVSYYKGRIWAESELGAGSVFHVELPVPAEAGTAP